MLPVQLIVCDLDGTLVSRSGRLGSHTRAVVAEVRRRGVRFTVATSRLFHSALPIAAELSLADPLICCDGSTIRHAHDGEAVRDLFLPAAIACEAFAQLFFYADSIFLLGREAIYAAPAADVHPVAAWGNRVIRFDPSDELPDGLQAILAFGQQDLLEQAAALLSNAGLGIDVTLGRERVGDWLVLAVRPCGADKGSALADLCARLALCPDGVMVFGDWPDDLPMFRAAGLSVAPRNAHPTVKHAATYVSEFTSDEEFVARELERMVLGQRPHTLILPPHYGRMDVRAGNGLGPSPFRLIGQRNGLGWLEGEPSISLGEQ